MSNRDSLNIDEILEAGVTHDRIVNTTSLEITDLAIIQGRLLRLTTGVDEIEKLFPTIRLNQLDALNKLKEFLRLGKTKGYFRMPTGAGKTILFGLIAKILNEPTLILVPNVTLLKSTKREFIKLGIDPETIGLVGDRNNETGRQFTVMTYNSFLTRGIPERTSLVVCDEVHRSLGEKTRGKINEVLDKDLETDEYDPISEREEKEEEEALSRLNESKDKILNFGFTATPKLGFKSVDEIHGELIAETFYKDLIKAGFLKHVESHQVEGEIDEETESNEVLTREREDRLLAINSIQRKTLETYLEFKENFKDYPLRPIAFCHSIQGAEDFMGLLAEKGLKGYLITGKEGDLEKAEAQLLAGEIDFIVAIKKPMEGWDFPPVNTVLWLRATSSPANLIQGVGRGMRAFEKEGFTHLFETDWRVSKRRTQTGATEKTPIQTNPPEDPKEGVKTKKRPSTKALTFAQALADSGEDIEGVISNSENVDYIQYVTLNKSGVAEVNGLGPICSLGAYADSQKIDRTTLKDWIEEAKVQFLTNTKGRGNSGPYLDVYIKGEVDSVITKHRPGQILHLDKDGTAEAKGVGMVCSLNLYAKKRGISPGTLKYKIEEDGIQNIVNIKGKGKSGPLVDLFLKSDIDALIASVNKSDQVIDLNDDGTAEVDNIGTVCGLASYAIRQTIAPVTLKKWLTQEGVEAIPNIKGKSGSNRPDLFLKSEVDRVIDVKIGTNNGTNQVIDLSDDGTTEIETFGKLCGLNSYGRNLDVDPSRLKKWIAQEGVEAIPNIKGKSGGYRVDLFPKAEVDKVISKHRTK